MFLFCTIPLSGILRNILSLIIVFLSIRPDLITDDATQGGSFVYFRLSEQAVEHNWKIYDLFSPGFALDFLVPQMCDVSLYYYLCSTFYGGW